MRCVSSKLVRLGYKAMRKKKDEAETLEEIYTKKDHAGSYASAGELYKEARRRGLGVSRADVEEFAAGQLSQTMFRRAPKGKRVATFAAGLNHKWQLDLGFYPAYRGIVAFLVCVDVLSRKCYLKSLRGRTASHVARAFEEVLRESQATPSYVITDRGSEFLGAAFQRLLASLAIVHYYANPPHKAALAERVIGWLKQEEGRLAQAFPGRNWPERLQSVSRRYNDTVNAKTGLSPNQVSVDNANRVFRKLFKPFAGVWDLQKLVKVGTVVRLKLSNRGTFAKANVPRNSPETYIVGRIRLHPRAGVKYKLFTQDANIPIAGTYHRSEIIPIALPQR